MLHQFNMESVDLPEIFEVLEKTSQRLHAMRAAFSLYLQEGVPLSIKNMMEMTTQTHCEIAKVINKYAVEYIPDSG